MDRRTLTITLRSRPKAVYWTGAAIVIIVAIITDVVVMANRSTPTQPVAYTNISRNFKACLLTTTADTTEATPDWVEVQAAAQNRPINAQHVVAPSGSTSELVPYLNSLLALHCQLIITAGPDLSAALGTVAKAHPQQQFANISQAATVSRNIHDLPNATPAAIADLVTTTCGCH
jgi:basic membrane lipoprotein Med (substrate-binding protein (PBP1-ABC) superfamily)